MKPSCYKVIITQNYLTIYNRYRSDAVFHYYTPYIYLEPSESVMDLSFIRNALILDILKL